MLASLRSIIQDVNSAESLKAALDIIVCGVRKDMGTEVCSVYMLDDDSGELIFMATQGLNQAAEGKVRLAKSQGLVGLVAQREEPINLENAEEHPRFQYFPEIGEEKCTSFLGAPIIHHRKVLGVLVVQQADRRRFDESEEAFLVTISAQLAGVIAHAKATGAVHRASTSSKETIKFTGVAGAPGVASGHAVVVAPPADLSAVPSKKAKDIESELTFFKRCIQQVRHDIQQLGEELKPQLAREELALFDVYLGMLDDAALGKEVEGVIRSGEWAQGALSKVMMSHVRTFERMDDPYLKERAADVRDLGRRVLAYLQEDGPAQVEYPDNCILVGEELTASMLGEVPNGKLAGLVSVRGSNNSHVAILARSMGLPTVMGAVDLPFRQVDGHRLIVDGYNGVVFSNASDELQSQYDAIYEEEKLISRGLEALKDLPCETTDGHRIPLLVNTGLMADVARSLDKGAEGVGLYRTEVPFLLRDRFPSEEEQRQIYRRQLEAFHPRPVTMRTLDIGGDKALPYFPIEEENPFLGWRGIRVTLDHPEIFLGQLRAMLKASEGLGNLQILLPMISSVTELEEALELVYRAHDELVEDGLELELPPIGVMVEVPSAVYQARQLAKRVDFLSVGSNDLTQYLLAVDRNNARVAGLYQTYHPAVLQACKIVADAARDEGKKVSICGELAGDPAAAVLLMAMGYDSLSMNATNLPKVKSAIRHMDKCASETLLNRVLVLDNPRDIRDILNEELVRAGVSQPQAVLNNS